MNSHAGPVCQSFLKNTYEDRVKKNLRKDKRKKKAIQWELQVQVMWKERNRKRQVENLSNSVVKTH